MDRKELDKHGMFLMDYGKKHGIIFRLTRKTFSIEVLDKGKNWKGKKKDG